MNKQEHLLTILGEECNEIAQRVTKALRFGITETEPGQDLNNAERIIYEFNDLIAVMEILCEKNILPFEIYHRAVIDIKKQNVEKYLDYSKQVGTLQE